MQHPCYIWDRVFENGQSKICGRQPLKDLKGYRLLQQTISFQLFKGCLPQNLLGPFLNTLSHPYLLPFKIKGRILKPSKPLP